jgi:Flp pilus assembly protein CpaB
VALTGAQAANGGYIQHKKIPAEFRPTSAVTKLSTIANKEAVAPYGIGQVLVSSMFASASSVANGLAQSLPAGNVAVTASVDQVHGVADLPAPGDKVDLMVTVNNEETILLQDVSIIAVGQTTVSSSATDAQTGTASTNTVNTSGLYTFSVTPTNAERIALAQEEGLGLYMTLPSSTSTPVTIPPVSQGNIASAQ